MQPIAREMAFSESTFICPRRSRHPGADPHLHARRRATDGRASDDRQHVRAGAGGRDQPGATRVGLRTGRRTDAGGARMEGRSARLRVDDAATADVWRTGDRSAASLPPHSGSRSAISSETCPSEVRIVRRPVSVRALATRKAVDATEITAHDVSRLSPIGPGSTIFRSSSSRSIGRDQQAMKRSTVACSRRDSGIVEDPATGGASGPLGCYISAHASCRRSRLRHFVSLQGMAR